MARYLVVIIFFCLPAKAENAKWNGYYLGVGAGHSWVKANSSSYSAINGAFLGSNIQEFDYSHLYARATYNQMISSRFLIGTVLTAVYTFTERDVASGTGTIHYRNEWAGALVGRVGYVFQEHTLLYALAGGNAVRTRSVRQTPLVTDYLDTKRIVPIVGIGVEFMIAPNWTVLFEARRNFLGEKRINFTNAGFFAFSESEASVLQFAINYRFAN